MKILTAAIAKTIIPIPVITAFTPIISASPPTATTGINEITLEVSEIAQNVMVTVTEHGGKPSAVSIAKNGEIYKCSQLFVRQFKKTRFQKPRINIKTQVFENLFT